jgi:two-component system nitrogen regulation sensor histidine kinase GlnL
MSDGAAFAVVAGNRRLDDARAILDAMAASVLVIGPDDRVGFVNGAGEGFFASSAGQLIGRNVRDLLPQDSPFFSLIEQVRKEGASVSEYGVTLDSPRISRHFVNIQAAPLADDPACIVVTLFERSIADKIDRQLTHRNAARSVTAMAMMLAHEVKNPLSGIRGAAQLLEQSASEEDIDLTRLIRDEADRIVALVDRMEVFSDSRPIERGPVNIHEVLEHVRKLATSGFARNAQITERYDPSLPPVLGNRDQLVQVFLNLIKNAAEAAPDRGGEVELTTAYQHGVRFAVPGTGERMHLPLVISIQDNGDGIPEDLQDHLFDAFVTSKPKGSGLGLALVAKIVGDHGGVVEFDSQPGRTVFRVMLPMYTAERETGT